MVAQRTGAAILTLVAGMGATTANHAILKLLALNAPPGQVLFGRGILIIMILFAAVLVFGEFGKLRAAFSPPVLVRASGESVASVLFIVAVVHMPIAELYTVISVSPLLMTVISVLLYKEVVGWRRWVAVMVGFLGALLIIRPDPNLLNWWALLGLVIALAVACRDLASSRIHISISALGASLVTGIVLTLASLILGLGEEWRPFTRDEWLLVAGAALSLSVGIYLTVVAFRLAQVSILAPFRYVTLLWGAIAGYLLFTEVPDSWGLAGAALIVASGLYIIHRERIRRRKPPVPTPSP